MAKVASASSLVDPDAPVRSAKQLLDRSRLPPLLRQAALQPLARWLSAQPECLRPDPGGTVVAIRVRGGAGAGGRRVGYRLSNGIADVVRRLHLRYLRLAHLHVRSHPDEQVRRAADKVLRGLLSGRTNWEQTAAGLAVMRSRILHSGRRRMRETPVVPERTIAVRDRIEWRRVTSVARLQAIGRAASLCTADGSSHAAAYARQLRSGQTKFYELVAEEYGVLGLVSIDEDDVVEEARARGGGLLLNEIDAVTKLLAATGYLAEYCPDLVAVGIARGFEAIDRHRPDLTIDGVDLWQNSEGSILVRFWKGWTVLRDACETYACMDGSSSVVRILAHVAKHLIEQQRRDWEDECWRVG